MHDSWVERMAALHRIIRHVQNTLDHSLQLYKSYFSSLLSYPDVDWGRCPNTCRSTSGYWVILGDNLVSWSFQRQPTISKSSVEAEYRSVANVVSETCWIHTLLLELHYPIPTVTFVYCDNVSDAYHSGNLVHHQRAKHIKMNIHFVREKVRSGQICVFHVFSRYQIVDIFTPRGFLSFFLMIFDQSQRPQTSLFDCGGCDKLV